MIINIYKLNIIYKMINLKNIGEKVVILILMKIWKIYIIQNRLSNFKYIMMIYLL